MGLDFLLASSLLSLLVFAFPVFLVGVAASYAALRSRDAKSDHPDPELGLKVAYHFFLTVGVLLALAGLTYNLYDLIHDPQQAQQVAGRGGFGQPAPPARPADEPRLWSDAMRMGWAVVASGVFFAVVFFAAVKFGTNDRRWPAARRVFVGWRLLIAGCLVIAATTGELVILFRKDMPTGGAYELMIAVLAVWAPALVVHVFLMKRYAKLAYYVPPAGRESEDPVSRGAGPGG